jgi:hypothetical protein
MQSGTLGVPIGEAEIIGSEIYTVEKEGSTLKRSIKASNPITTPSGHRMVEGTVSMEEKVEFRESEIDENGDVQSESYFARTATTARFYQVPNHFLFLESGAPTSMFDILGQSADCAYEPAEIDIDGYILDQEEASLWMLGFYETGTRAENGTLYGNDLADDPLASDIFQTSSCNQVGIEHFYSDDSIKARVSESGFIEVYSPEYEGNAEFVDYLVDVLVPHIARPTA